jgi:hypothetical protein
MLGTSSFETSFFLVSEAVLLLALTLVTGVIPVIVVVLVGGVKLLSLGQSAMKWVVSPHSKQPLGDILLSLRNLCKLRTFSPAERSRRQRCSRTAHHKLHTRKIK